MNEFGLKSEEMAEILNILRRNGIKKAKIFGSRALGTFHEYSDVDIAIWGDVGNIKEELDDSYLSFLFDIIIYEKIQNAELKEHIDVYGKEII